MLRFEYDAVVAFHPYRTDQPWDLGGVRILHVDGVNLPEDERCRVTRRIGDLERSLLAECADAGIRAERDNHYGFTVRVNGRVEPGAVDGFRSPDTYYQLRFSDGSLYVWLMPGAPARLP